ncbi:MAG: diguanylate cyclase/phosphodiesterase with PAS/PAC sensor(s) [uncultured bacterium]|nr:MAG: diguanylate cyclase/phosphodiesterase with PAS/PAC sensor(s) [uncultured bacterium]
MELEEKKVIDKTSSPKQQSDKEWKIFIVDDEKSIHDITKLVLSDLIYEDKKLTFLHAYNIEEAKKVFNENPDISVVILDVVMEEEDSGLKFVKYIRDDAKNDLVRIVLRTGQPGLAPESKIITEYDVNDYKEKTELTSGKLHTLIITSLRSYCELLDSKKEQDVIKEQAQITISEKDEYIKLIADALPVLISFIDKDETIKFFNKTHQSWFDIPDDKINGMKIEELIGNDAYEIFRENWFKAVSGHTINFDMQLSHSSLGVRNTNVTLVPHTFFNEFRGCFSLISDITERKQMEENLNFLAKHDVLTGLHNRAYFDTYIDNAIHKAQKENKMIGILFLDIDGFKRINDTLGHEYGDILLLSTSTRLKECLRKSDTIARFGGDEFMLMLESITNIEEISVIAEKIINAMSKPFLINKQEFVITASIGISVYPKDGVDKDILLKNADLAMYHIKERGKNGYQYYTDDFFDSATDKYGIENDLRLSLIKEDFELYYQPIIDLKSGKIDAVEALIRWNHPKRGLLLPSSFIPITEETGIIIPISEWIIRTACNQIHELQKNGFPDLKVSINVSASQFIKPNFIKFVTEILNQSGIQGKHVQFELTENILITNFDLTYTNIQKLKEMDISVVLDDFGSGFSSLNYLSRLPIEGIKIDESFSKFVTTDLRSAAIISTITQLMHKLGIKTVVEAIENTEQLYFVSSCNCDMIQGNLVGEPVPISKLKSLLENYQHPDIKSIKNPNAELSSKS